MIRRRFLAMLPLLATLPLSVMPNAEAGQTNMIQTGDSITYMGTDDLLALRPGAKIDGVPGRKVSSLIPAQRAMLDRWGTPKNLVIALGQNEVPEWTAADYVEAVEMVPPSTHVFFVSTYRDPEVFGQERADIQLKYTRWMRNIAENRANVFMVEWRLAVLDGRATLVDGSHPDEASQAVWADLINKAITESWA